MASSNKDHDATLGDTPTPDVTPDQTLALPEADASRTPERRPTASRGAENDQTLAHDSLMPESSQEDKTLVQDVPKSSAPRNDQTLAHDSLAYEPIQNDQTLAHDSLMQNSPPIDRTLANDELLTDASVNDQTLAHDSMLGEGSVNDQTLAHDSMAPANPDPTLRKEGGYRRAGGVKLSLASGAGSFVTPGDVEERPESNEQVPGYEILGELGRGAMGVVYKARQVGLKRIVALKMILSGGHASSAEITRFRTEAEAVARLQHPYVVQVFEIGEHQGLPFFSLEFVEGGCLADKIMENPMPLREAADLVRKLAEGMTCAHENGIVHRDLKPANVLLTREGDPKITDFGLAKKLEEDSGATRAGAIMGTPSYMAPEQAEGRVDLIGPHSDIYALGAILYDLITGRPPFRGATVLETLTQVRINEPVSPARLHPKMPRDLETITLKCLLKEPKKRYHTARDLAEDLRRFLAGEPILARPVGSIERAWKWCKRRPTTAALIGVSVLSLVLLAVGGVAYARVEQLRAEEAERLKQEADEQRDRAQEHFRQAREAVDQMLSRVGQETFGYEPRMEKVRRDLLERAAAFHERFMQIESEDPSVRHGTAASARQVGDARKQLGQMNEAEKAYRRSVELLEPLVAEYPDEPTYQQDLAAACNNLANLLRERNRFAEAEPLSDRAIELFKTLSDQLTNEPVWKRELANAYYNRATLDRASGKTVPAALCCRTALKLQQQLLLEPGADPQTQSETVRSWNLLGQLRAASHPEEAESSFREAINLSTKLVNADPTNARFREDLMFVTLSLGDLLRNVRPNEAGPLLRRAVDLGKALVADFPTVPDYKQQLSVARNSLGVWQLADGRRAAARESFEQSLAIQQRLCENFPRRPEYQRDLARSEGNVAVQLLTAGLFGDATPHCRRAVEILRDVIQDYPGNPADDRELALALVRLATVDLSAAEKSLREALAIQERLLKSNPQSREFLAERTATLSGLGAVLLANNQPKEAEALLDRAEKDYRDLISRLSEEPDYRFGLASVRINQGELFRHKAAGQDAATSVREAVSLLDALAKQYPNQVRYLREQAKAQHNLGIMQTDAKKLEEAENALREALTIRQYLMNQMKGEPAYVQDYAATLSSLAIAQTFRNNLQAAERNFQRSIESLRRLVEQQPSEPIYARDLAKQQQNLARLFFALGRDDDAYKTWRQAVSARQRLTVQQPTVPDFRLEVSNELLQLAQACVEETRWNEARSCYQDAAGHLREGLKLLPNNAVLLGQLSIAQIGAAEACLGSRDHVAAAKHIEEAMRNAGKEWAYYPAVAATLARCSGLASGDAALAKSYADRSLDALRKAHANGFNDADALEKAKEFAAVRNRDDFKKLLAQMRKK